MQSTSARQGHGLGAVLRCFDGFSPVGIGALMTFPVGAP